MLHLERSGDTFIATLKKEGGLEEDHPLEDLTEKQPCWLPNEEKPVWVGFWSSGGSYVASYYITIFDTSGTEAILFHTEIHYCPLAMEDFPWDVPYQLEKQTFKKQD